VRRGHAGPARREDDPVDDRVGDHRAEVSCRQVPAGHSRRGSAVLALAMAASALQNRVVVLTGGIRYWFNFRKHEIPWSSIRSFEVGRAQGAGPWSSLVVNSATGQIRINTIVGTRSLVQKTASELSALQRDHAGPDARTTSA